MEPIAIVGIGCRFPGAPDLDAYWRLLRGGVDAIREVPKDRWDLGEFYDPDAHRPGRMTTRWGGFLDRVDAFDPTFFGISPREATSMDPQQRLLLEVAWEALEDAGVVLEQWAGRPAGVFVGIATYDYGAMQMGAPDRIEDGYANTGSAMSIAANRISYLFDLRGPSVAVDTACSSSLAAAHLACQSLWSGESAMALAGGVNLILSPAISIGFSKLKAMALDGRCKSFDARADGYVRGEGAGVVVLKLLSQALRDGDRIHALVRGSAMNQDGRTNGLTAPNGLSQEALIRQALERAGVEPRQVAYVEAHGTGTPLGDPIEVTALGAALAPGRPPGSRCALGSVKTNFGHLEAAAGIAGLIKVALALEHREIPPSLHFESPNPHIPFDTLPLAVQRTLGVFPDEARPALAGVSSFGFGGTNVHVVLEEPPAPPDERKAAPAGLPAAHVVALSARSPEAVQALARSWRDALGTDVPGGPALRAPLRDLAYSSTRRRTHHDHRLAVVAHTHEELREALDAHLAGEARPGLVTGRVRRGRARKLAFVFPGQGSQWFGMARNLLDREPVFRAALEQCDAAIRDEVEWSVLQALHADAEHSPLGTVDVIQPALWAIQVGLAALWQSWGVVPDAVIGHSMGEVAASYVAGALPLEHAAAVICRRSRLLRRTSGRGAMAAVELSLEEAREAISRHEERVSIAVSNSPTSTVLSGEVAALEEILAALEARGIFCRRVKVDVASHSPQMDPLRADLLQALQSVRSTPPRIPLYSTVNAQPLAGEPLDAGYWVRNLREPVLFSRTVARLVADGHTTFVELSPHPILLASVQQTLQHLNKEGTVLPSLRREEDEQAVMLGSLGALYTQGRPVDWAAVSPSGRVARLPSYPWQRERYWREEAPVPRRGPARGEHPLLGAHVVSGAHGTHLWDTEVGPDAFAGLSDHRVQGAVVLPAAAYLDMALAAARAAFGPGAHALEGVTFARALVLAADRAVRVQLAAGPPSGGRSSFQVFSFPAGEGAAPVLHASGTIRLARAAEMAAGSAVVPGEVQARCVEVIAAADHYAQAATRGLDYGPAFQGLTQAWRRDGEALARLRAVDGASPAHVVPPALLDAAFQALAAALPRDAVASGSPYVPVALGALTLDPTVPPAAAAWGHAVVRETGRDAIEGDVFLRDDAGRVALAAHGLRVQRLERAAPSAGDDLFYALRWRPAPLSADARPPAAAGPWLVFADEGGIADAVRAHLAAAGERCVVVTAGAGYESAGADTYRIDLSQPDHFARLLSEAGAGGARGVLSLWGLDGAEDPESGTALQASVERACLGAVHLVQSLAAAPRPSPRLWLVTAGAQAASAGDRVRVGPAALWGLGRSLGHEHPELRCTNVDLGADAAEAQALVREVLAGGVETQVALRGTERLVARLVRAIPDERKVAPTGTGAPALAAGENFGLAIETPGILDNLGVRPRGRRAPGRGEVEIEVHAAGLNFLDVLGALGLRPDTAGGPPPLGAECAGVITAVGEGVEGLAAGDEVVAVAPSSFSAFTVTRAELVARKPPALSFAEAATVPIAFLTAEYALRRLGRLRRGESVLIHAGAGGVGLAAIQIAQRAGAEVFATAGSEEKRAYLRSLGVRHVMDSRTLAFADEVREKTGGRGVDVVLNSLSGEAIPKSLSTLAAYGRFLEIGKRDIYEDRPLGLKPFQDNLSFFAVDLNRAARERPALVGSLLRRLMRALETGALTPLRHEAFPVSEGAAAFRHMAQARHIGKVVLDLRDPQAARAAAAAPGRVVRADGAYLVTGGLGGLGLTVARALAEDGAREVVLLGRGAPSEEARAAIAGIEEAGARVRVAQADVADEGALARVLEEARSHGPLRGIVHAAGRLDDGTVLRMDRARFASVMAPKVAGAWNLHALTASDPLDWFVLFSSAASVLGSPGQANYAAANACLDALAQARRAAGRPAVSVNWGPWSEVGLAVRPDRGGRLAAGGMRPLAPTEGVAALRRVLRSSAEQVAVVSVDWPTFVGAVPTLAQAPLLAEIVAAPPADVAAGAAIAAVAAAGPKALEARLQEHVARVLRMPPAKLDVNRPLSTLGIDSLMAVELKNRIETELKVSLPLIQIAQGPSVAELAALLLEQMAGTAAAAAPSTVAATAGPDAPSLLVTLLAMREGRRDA